jgi:hypothetical protein
MNPSRNDRLAVVVYLPREVGALGLPIEANWGKHMNRIRVLVAVAVIALIGAACVPLSNPGVVDGIQFVSSTNANGWKYDYYRNISLPCSVSGYQTFVIGTKVGSSPTAARPLWTFMHGGGAGYFDANGNPYPNANQKVEESDASLRNHLTNNGLMAKIRADSAGFRTLAVSYCSHDVYGGMLNNDPNNAGKTEDGRPRSTTGLMAVKAAIQYTESLYPATKRFLHGGSAGSVGTYGVAWSMQQQGIAPAGVVADATVVNVEGRQAAFNAGICSEDNDPARGAAIAARVHPDLANIDNEADKLIASGRLTVPFLHIWNHGDGNTCGSLPLACPMRDGSTVTMGVTDCLHEPVRQAIAAQGPTSKSKNLPLCVDNDAVPDCGVHVTTTRAGLVNTDPASPADYLTAVMDWVHLRLADA